MSDPALELMVDAFADLRNMAAPLILARHERRRQGATAGERLSTPQHIAMLALAEGPRTMSSLAAATGVALSTATRMVQTLEREGWVERPEAAPGDDRRRRPVGLTPAGRRVMDEASEFSRMRLRRLLERLEPAEYPAVLEALQALRRVLQEDAEADPVDAVSKASSISQSAGASGASGEAPSGRIPSSTTPR
jgi:DNA-binding MarR family transcriptional regulator